MIRLLIFIALVLALGFGFAWLADRPGEMVITWQGQQIEMSLMVAVSTLVSLIVAVMITWWIIKILVTSPQAFSRYFRARKRDRGYQALSTGLIAAGAGDAATAKKMNKRARGLIRVDQEPLIHLLEAQTALIEGRHDEARQTFEAMVDDPETRELGLRGLYLEARRLGADEAARQYAERASANAPQLPWAAEATLEYRALAGDFDTALAIVEQQKSLRLLPKDQANRKRAVLLTGRAMQKLENDPKGAREDAKQALNLVRGFVPAATIAADTWFREGNVRRGAAILESAWKINPHPELAALYVRARSGDSAVDRLKRAQRLEAMKPNNVVSQSVVAEAALSARRFDLARSKAEAAARLEPREGLFLLLADIEDAETGDQGRVRYWMGQALRAPRDPAWTADGHVSEHWAPVSPISGQIDVYEWRTPMTRLPAETDMVDMALSGNAWGKEHGQDGDRFVNEALAGLPPIAASPAAGAGRNEVEPETAGGKAHAESETSRQPGARQDQTPASSSGPKTGISPVPFPAEQQSQETTVRLAEAQRGAQGGPQPGLADTDRQSGNDQSGNEKSSTKPVAEKPVATARPISGSAPVSKVDAAATREPSRKPEPAAMPDRKAQSAPVMTRSHYHTGIPPIPFPEQGEGQGVSEPGDRVTGKVNPSAEPEAVESEVVPFPPLSGDSGSDTDAKQIQKASKSS